MLFPLREPLVFSCTQSLPGKSESLKRFVLGELMPDRIREYEFLESLGKGGMGEVFKARHVLRDRLFAVKVIRKELSADPQHRLRFLREARILLDLDHPAIVRSLDVFEEQERLYLVMELLEGEPLSALLNRATPRFAAGQALLLPILEAVAHAHRLGIIHRDLKPSNVFIRKDGSVKVLDFGLAKELGDASLTTAGHGLGTPAYMAPEVFTGERKIAEIGPEGDVYALGVIAYRLFTGRMPFDLPEEASSLEAMAHLTRHYVSGKPAPDIVSLSPEMPKPFAMVIMAALAVNPAVRLKDAGELLTALLDWQSPTSARGHYSPPPTTSDDNTIIHSLPKFKSVHDNSTTESGGGMKKHSSTNDNHLSNKKEKHDTPRKKKIAAILMTLMIIAGGLAYIYKDKIPWLSKTPLVDPVTKMEFVWVKGGIFDLEKYNDVTKKKEPAPLWINSFLIGKYEVTQGQWKAVMGNNPSHFKDCGDNCPVEQVSWHDAQAFIKKLNSLTGRAYRLPTKDEWEYAMSAGRKKQKWAGTDNVDELGDYAWISVNSGYSTHPVGQKKPNRLSIYDMSGNVGEWCQDQFELLNKQGEAVIEPATRHVRGLNWTDTSPAEWEVAAAPEANQDNYTGFRLARSLTAAELSSLK